jgi:hypothetical protein
MTSKTHVLVESEKDVVMKILILLFLTHVLAPKFCTSENFFPNLSLAMAWSSHGKSDVLEQQVPNIKNTAFVLHVF